MMILLCKTLSNDLYYLHAQLKCDSNVQFLKKSSFCDHETTENITITPPVMVSGFTKLFYAHIQCKKSIQLRT